MKEEKIKTFMVISGFIFMSLFCLLPFFYMIVISLSKTANFLSSNNSFTFTLENYHSIITLKSLHFMDYLKNSFIISVVSAFFAVFIAILAAFAITRMELPGKISILFFVLVTSMFPQISLIGYLFKIMAHFGWINTYGALIFPYISWILPLSLWILVSYFAQLPKDLDKAASLDGCSNWQILIKIIFPLALPGIFSTLLLAFIFAFNEFMFALMLTTDYHSRTLPVGIALFQGLHGEIPWGNIMAAASVTVMPLIILTIILQKYIIQGLTQGAVKG